MEKNEQIRTLRNEFDNEFIKINNLKELNDLRIKYLGRKGPIQEISKLMGTIEADERKELGMLLNNLRNYMMGKIDDLDKKYNSEEIEKKLIEQNFDVTLPSTKINIGSKHPLTKIINEIEELFISMGYDIVEGPEIESDLYNFEYLNVPKNHPARDMQDSFYLTEDMLLRTQTSTAQIRTMLNNEEKSPIRMISPGKVYRKDNDDATHSHQFTQIEGLVVDKDISMAHLKGTLELVAKRLFGDKREIRFRPSYFPFTEPSLEVDVNCFNCESNGCSICKDTGWIEILGAGMVHPNVLDKCGYNSKIYTGFAFGLGVERIAMLKYGISDIRELYLNDLKLLKQVDRIEGGE
jgi:phenylalanyl-tRNA synthetase alpha chain